MQDIASESILIAGGGRAILLQIANPAVGRGVAAHSDFASRPLERLGNTLHYVYAVVYGTPKQRAAAVRAVARAHAPVQQRAGENAPGYSAFDPALQLWVAATLYHSAVDVYERVYGPLDAASAERVYREYAVLGTALQVPPEIWPEDLAAFDVYFTEQLSRLAVGDETRFVANALLRPATTPWWFRAVMPIGRLVTAGLLPPPVRADFGLAWSDRRQRRFDRLMTLLRAIYPRLPRKLRQLPRDRALS